jgi:F-type H+-transporting ATPase subunit epsilon
MATFSLTIVTPAGNPFDGEAAALSAPGEEGSFGVLAHHAPMIAGLRAGILSVTPEPGAPPSFFVTGEGVLEVKLDGSVVILADKAEPAPTLDAAKTALAEDTAD